MIDRRHIGTQMPPFTVDVEASRLRFFAKATGQTDPVYSDEASARAAGHPGLPVPPHLLLLPGDGRPQPRRHP